jgi:hypothetical protein
MTEFIESIKNKVEINIERLELFVIYSFILIILMRFSLYPSLYSYDSNAHILVSDCIIANAYFPIHSAWIKLGPDDAILPLFSSFFGMISIMTNIPTYYIGKYIFPALTFTIIFIFAYLILKSVDKTKLAFPFLILCLFFIFTSPKVLQNLACSVRPEILGILLLLAFKYSYIRFIKDEQSKDLVIPLMIGITIILIHYLAGLFFVSSFLIYGIFLGDKKVGRYNIINEFTIAFAFFAFFWGIAIFGGSDIYDHLYYIFKGSANKPTLFLIPLIGIFVIKKSVPFGIAKFKGVLPRFKNLLERYQSVLILSLLAVLFASLKIVSTTSDFKIFLANNIHWIVFIPLSFFYLLNHIVNENKDRRISFLSCFLFFSYFFSFVFLLILYVGISGFFTTDWVIRFIGYAFFEMTVFGMFFARDIFGQSTLKNLKIHSKVALLLILLITNIFVTAYYVDKPGDKFPPMVASDPMLSAEKYVIEGVQPKYVTGLPPFIYENFDFRRKLKLHYDKGLPDIIHDLSKGKNLDKDYTLYLNTKRIKKYGGIQVGMDLSKIAESELHKIENNPALSKIYSNDEVDIYDSYKRDD